jgi:prepilin-type N-terminal cleavage/methylation domain-containing protein
MKTLILSKKGFTLLEVLAAVLIFLVISVPAITIISSSVDITKKAHTEFDVNVMTLSIQQQVLMHRKKNKDLPKFSQIGEVNLSPVDATKYAYFVKFPEQVNEETTDKIAVINFNKELVGPKKASFPDVRYSLKLLESKVRGNENTNKYGVFIEYLTGNGNWVNVSSFAINVNDVPPQPNN